MSNSIELNMKLKNIDQWNRLKFKLSKEAYDMLKKRTQSFFQNVNPLKVWTDSKGNDHYFFNVKLSKWHRIPCNFQKLQQYMDRDVTCKVHLNEYDFEGDFTRHQGWTAVLADRSLKFA